jgi:Zn-dependent protease with chaperone function
MREARPIALPASPVPAYRVHTAFPVFSTVGMLRPRIFVATQVLDALTDDEAAAAVAHEAAHLRARDNLKRLLLRSCPDLLAAFPVSRELEESWARAAETVADARAARGAGGAALDLASAIVKVARLAPVGTPMLPASALHDGGDVAPRVRCLLDRDRLCAIDGPSHGHGSVLLAAAMGSAALAAMPRLLPAVHHLTELAAAYFR